MLLTFHLIKKLLYKVTIYIPILSLFLSIYPIELFQIPFPFFFSHTIFFDEGVYDSLKFGGEFYFSDVYSDRRLSKEVQIHEVLWGECISGALYIEDFKRICSKIGFLDIRMVSKSEIDIIDPLLKDVVGNARFVFSVWSEWVSGGVFGINFFLFTFAFLLN